MFVWLSHLRTWLLSKPYRLIILVVLLIVIGVLVWRSMVSAGDTKPEYTTAVVTRGNIENLVTATGILQPRDYVDVGAQVSGQLDVLHVEVGSEVNAGDLLAEIDATVYLAKVDGTRASLRNQRAMLTDRQAQLTLAEINFKRQKNLYKADASTQESLESAEASLQSAQAQLAGLTAQIEQIESSLRAEEANLKFASIYAPMTGTVVSITSRQGQTLNTNQVAPTLLRIADLSTMTVQTQVSEADVGKLRIGMPVYFTTLGSEGRRWYSELNRIEPTPTVLNNVVLYNALFDVPNTNKQLMTQMTTQVFFVRAAAQDVVLVPMSALTFNRRSHAQINRNSEPSGTENTKEGVPASKRISQNNHTGSAGERGNLGTAQGTMSARVQVLTSKGKFEEREVKVGVTNRVQAEIISGLSEGDEIVTGQKNTQNKPGKETGRWGGQPRMMR